MTVERDSLTDKIKYTYSDDVTNETYVYRPDQVFHVKGLSFDGVKGISPIAQAREAIGLSLATEEYGAKFFGNGARPAVYWNTQASSKTPKNSASHGTRSIRGHGTAIRSPFSKRA